GDPDAVAVAGDTGHYALDDAARAGAVRAVHRTEPQRVHQRNRARAHGEDVADDAADTGRGSLVGLDEGRMVVGFDLEDRGESVADIHSSRILAGALQYARSFRRQRPEVHARTLVAAVLRPHHREDPKFR